ncbi:MAG: T9SS type A sorting domain-containing protein [Paludibacteraceae bacterium]|nr:T9SS type A sorting domain-containing protein [Paludibacteraceae bacterium]
MKKSLFLIILATISNLLVAQTECSTIAEIRNLENGSTVKYTGLATTTYYGVGGILIQDETGALYIKNAQLAESGSSRIKTNMQITSISGTFKKSSSEEMSHIEVANRAINSIEIKNQEATFTITDITPTDFLANPQAFECQPIRLSNVDVKSTGWAYYISNNTTEIALVAGWGVTIPARGTFEGYYGNNGTQGFIVQSATAQAFATIINLKEAYETVAPNTLEIIEPMVVSHIRTNADNSADIYAQQTDQYMTTCGICLHIEQYNLNITAGDSISGVKGLFTAYTDGKGSTFNITAEDAQNIQIISSNNTIETTLIDDLEYIMGDGVRNYESLLVVTPKGTISKDNDTYYLTAAGKKIIVTGTNFAKFEGQSVAIIGIVDAGLINQGKTTLIARSEQDVLATSYAFDNIADMKAQGEPLATGITYSLRNNVLVTHIHSWRVEELTIYGLFVQDHTAGLYIETQTKPNVAAGDSIKGIVGSYHGYIAQKSGAKFTIISSDNLDKIDYEDVTMATLKSNPEKYASQVVRLIGVGHGTRKVNNYGQESTQKYLYQDKDTMVYDIWNYDLYESNDIIGVFDYGSYQPFSIVPLSQAHITQSNNTKIDNLHNNIIHIKDNYLFAEGATSITIYNLNGQIIAQTDTDNININTFNNGVYVAIANIKGSNIAIKFTR